MRATATWALPKRIFSRSLCNAVTGHVLARWFNDQIPNRGCRFDTRSPAVPAISKAHIFWGAFESAEYRFVRDYLDPGVDVVEMGSGIGVISSFIARKLEPGRRLVCVEAHPELIELLQRNLRNNAQQADTTVVHAAVDSSALREPARFYCNPHYTGSQLSGAVDAPQHEVLVESTSLSDLLTDHEFQQYQLVADIEGAEARIFDAEPDALADCVRMIVELHDTVIEGRAVRVEDLRRQVTEGLRFQQIDRYGPVFVFSR